jgi:hypothetical protein
MLAIAAGISPALAGGFECPKAGTVVTYGQSKVTYRGADPTDPYICASEVNGKTSSLLFSWYAPDAEDQERISGLNRAKAALTAFFIGQKNKVSFELAQVVPHFEQFGMQNWKDTWQRIGFQTVSVGGQQIMTEQIRVTEEGMSGNTTLFWWDVWYDPVSHVFLRGRITVGRGYNHGRGYDATYLHVP